MTDEREPELLLVGAPASLKARLEQAGFRVRTAEAIPDAADALPARSLLMLTGAELRRWQLENDNALAVLRRELERAQKSLRDRKLIDRAKAVLMEAGLSEAVAYDQLKHQAMSRRVSIVELARALLESSRPADGAMQHQSGAAVARRSDGK